MTREEFNERIKELNKAGNENRISRAVLLLPFLFTLVVVVVVLPLAFINVATTSAEEFYNNGNNPFVVWVITIVAVFISIIISVFVSCYLLHKSRTKQFRSIIEKLDEFNLYDNQRGINWRIVCDVGQNP